MKASLLILAALVGWTSADVYTAGFTSAGTDPDATKLYIQSDFGTPIQVFKTRLYLNDGDPNPQLLNKRTCGSGFDPSTSTTFKWTSSFPGGVYGTDTIIFGDPINQPDTKFRILNDDCDAEKMFVSLRPSRGGDDFTFIGDFLLKQDDPVIVLNYAQIGLNGTLPTTGTLAVGNRLPSFCLDQWKYIPAVQVDGFDSWAIAVEQMSYNDDILQTPVKAKLSIDNYDFYVPEPYFTPLMKQLNVSTDGFIDCNADPNNVILLHVNGSYIKLGPGEYIDHSTVAKYKTCRSRIKCQPEENKFITLPLTIFKKYCLLLDFKNKNVGISLSKNPIKGSTAAFITTHD